MPCHSRSRLQAISICSTQHPMPRDLYFERAFGAIPSQYEADPDAYIWGNNIHHHRASPSICCSQCRRSWPSIYIHIQCEMSLDLEANTSPSERRACTLLQFRWSWTSHFGRWSVLDWRLTLMMIPLWRLLVMYLYTTSTRIRVAGNGSKLSKTLKYCSSKRSFLVFPEVVREHNFTVLGLSKTLKTLALITQCPLFSFLALFPSQHHSN